MDSFERSFTGKISKNKNEQARVTIPKHIIEDENIKNREKVRITIESIRG